MHIPKKISNIAKPSRRHRGAALADHATGSMVQMCQQIARQELKEIKIGMTDECKNKYDVRYLINVLRSNPLDCLESLCIGWRLQPRDHRLVCNELLPLVLRKGKIKKLQLILDSWIPQSLLWRILENDSLVHVDIQATRVQRRTQSDPRHNNTFRKFHFPIHAFHHGSHSSSSHTATSHSGGSLSSGSNRSRSYIRSHSGSLSNGSIGSNERDRHHEHAHHDGAHQALQNHHLYGQDTLQDDNIIQIVPFLSATVETLYLKDCDITDDHVEQLIDHLRDRAATQKPITKLSLRNNRMLSLDAPWMKRIFKEVPSLEILDLSLCDFDEIDGLALARALQDLPENSRLQSVNVAGNFRMTDAIPSLAQVCVDSGKIEQLDTSFCDVQNEKLAKVFNALAEAPEHCVMRSYLSQGSRIHDAVPLVNCVEKNKTLRSLVLCHRKETHPLSKHGIIELSKAMEHNYTLVELLVDCELQYRKFLKPANYWLALNRCGRRVVACGEGCNERGLPWQSIVLKAATHKDPNVLHWFLRNGLMLQ